MSRQLGSYKLLENQLLANCSNRAAAAAEDAGQNMTHLIQLFRAGFLKNKNRR
jgi:hypothetical protein